MTAGVSTLAPNAGTYAESENDRYWQMFHFMFTVGASMMPVTANIVATHRHSKYHHEQVRLACTLLLPPSTGF